MRKSKASNTSGPGTGSGSRNLIRAAAPAILLVMFFIAAGTGLAHAQTQPPQIFFTDLDSAPNSGGESVSGFAGAYVTIYGDFFGASQGSSTVTWNGLSCLRLLGPAGSYGGWGSSHFWYQKIVVQLGSGCTPGSGNFVVTVNGAASNPMPFTVRSTGKIYAVSTTGSDNNSGAFTSPFATIPKCKTTMTAGDVCYVQNGVSATAQDNFSAALEIETSGTAGNPIAFVAYPGATATLGSASLSYGLRVPIINIAVNYITVAGLTFSPSEIGFSIQGVQPGTASTNWRVIANNFQCPTANGEDGCFSTNEATNLFFYGNEATNVGVTGASKQQHAVYFSSDTNHVDAGWNYIHDNRSCRAMQFHSSPLNGGGASDPTGHSQFDLHAHDNLIHDDPCDGINFGTVDPSQGPVEAYNNVIYHVGIGPSPSDGDSGDYSCIYMAYITNVGAAGTGTVELYNNTLYDCGPFSASYFNNGAFMINGCANGSGACSTALTVRVRNNLVYQIAATNAIGDNEPFGNGGGSTLTDGGWSSTYTSGSNNLFFSTTGTALPSFLTATVNSDPMFLDLSLDNFHLQSASSAIDAGLTITSSNTYNNYLPWGGNPSDVDGVLRPQGSGYDIGAYEFFTGSDQRPNPPTNLSAVVH